MAMEILKIDLEEEILTGLQDEVFDAAKNPKYDRYSFNGHTFVYFLLWFTKFLI